MEEGFLYPHNGASSRPCLSVLFLQAITISLFAVHLNESVAFGQSLYKRIMECPFWDSFHVKVASAVIR